MLTYGSRHHQNQ